MNQQKVDKIGIQTLQRLFHRVGLLVKRGPQLGFQEDFFPRKAGFLHGASHGLFIDVGVRRVDQAIAVPQRGKDRSLRLVRRKKKGSDARHRHLNAVI